MSESQRISLYKALRKVKTLSKSIEQDIHRITPCSSAQSKSTKVNGVSINDYKQNVIESHESLVDRIHHLKRLKQLIAKANNETMISVNGIEVSIADAIVWKTVLETYGQSMINHYMSSKTKEEHSINRENDRVDAKVDSYLGNLKVEDSEAINALKAKHKEDITFYLVDPLNLHSKLNDGKQKFDQLLDEIDSALSEANATTFIEL